MKKFKLSFPLIAIAILILGGFFYWQNQQTKIPQSWQTYRNEKFGVEFKYPEYAKVCEIEPLHEEEKDLIFDVAVDMKGKCVIDKNEGLLADIFIHVDNIMFAAQQFADGPSKNNLQQRDFDGLRGFEGVVQNPNGQGRGYAVDINQGGHTIIVWDRKYDEHPEITKLFIDSLRFDQGKFPLQ